MLFSCHKESETVLEHLETVTANIVDELNTQQKTAKLRVLSWAGGSSGTTEKQIPERALQLPTGVACMLRQGIIASELFPDPTPGLWDDHNSLAKCECSLKAGSQSA